jgi:AP-4 complex subunit sigma-1
MIKFLLMVNKLGQTRVAQYYVEIPKAERRTLESELVRKCLSRSPDKSFILTFNNCKIIYRRYASLYFIIGLDEEEENEIAYYVLIHRFVQALDKYFENVVC